MNLLTALIESGMLREDSPGVLSWQPSMKRAENLAALLRDFEYKPFVGLEAKDLQSIPHDHYAGAIWADQKLREKNE